MTTRFLQKGRDQDETAVGVLWWGVGCVVGLLPLFESCSLGLARIVGPHGSRIFPFDSFSPRPLPSRPVCLAPAYAIAFQWPLKRFCFPAFFSDRIRREVRLFPEAFTRFLFSGFSGPYSPSTPSLVLWNFSFASLPRIVVRFSRPLFGFLRIVFLVPTSIVLYFRAVPRFPSLLDLKPRMPVCPLVFPFSLFLRVILMEFFTTENFVNLN